MFKRENVTPGQKGRQTKEGRRHEGKRLKYVAFQRRRWTNSIPDSQRTTWTTQLIISIGGKTRIEVTVKNLGEAPEMH